MPLYRLALSTLLLCSLCAHAFDIDIAWMRLSGSSVLDAPERPISATSGNLSFAEHDGDEPRAYRTLLSEHQGLIYLNIYRDAEYRQRSHKFGPLPLFSATELARCNSDGRQLDIDSWAGEYRPATGLLLLGYDVNCAHRHAWRDRRFVLLDARTPGQPLLAIGRADAADHISLTPLQPLPEKRADDWLALLAGENGARHYSLPAEPTRFSLADSSPPAGADDSLRALRKLHAEAFARKGDAASLAPLREFLVSHDYRQISADARDVPRLLNDIAFWLDAAGDPQAARPLLEEVLRREPERIAVQLNLADIDWTLHLQNPSYNRHRARAEERYRIYCGRRLARNMSVPERVLERLQLSAASEQACRPHWPLLDAIADDDLSLVERLIAQGVPGQVVGDDGLSALILALRKPNLAIADRLIAAGASLEGRYNGRTQLGHALGMDLKEDPQLSLATRLRYLAEAGAPFEEPELNDQTLLADNASNPRYLPILAELLRHRQDVDRRDKNGNNALERALSGGNLMAVDMLIATGAQLNQLYNGRLHCENMSAEYSPLQLLANTLAGTSRNEDAEYRRASLQTFTGMLSMGADTSLGQRCGLRGENVLLESLIRARRADLIAVLGAFGPPRQPLDYRVTETAMRSLKESRPAQQDAAWETLLAVLQRGAPVNPPTAPGRTPDPRLLAAQQTQLDADRYLALLQQGANPWLANAQGHSALPALIEARAENHLKAIVIALGGRPQYAGACAKPLLEIADSLTRSGRSASPATRELVARLLDQKACDPLEGYPEEQHAALIERLGVGMSRLDDSDLSTRLEQRLRDR